MSHTVLIKLCVYLELKKIKKIKKILRSLFLIFFDKKTICNLQFLFKHTELSHPKVSQDHISYFN